MYGSVNQEDPFLLRPSPSSTENPSGKNVSDDGNEQRSLIHHSNSSDIQLQSFQNSARSYYWGEEEQVECVKGKTVASYKWHFIMATLLLAAVGFAALLVSWKNTAERPVDLPFAARGPLSYLDPVKDLGLADYDRPDNSKPSTALTGKGKSNRPFPTNSWYQNLLMAEDEPNMLNRVNVVPYIVDAVGPIPGLRVHPAHIDGSVNIVQLNTNDEHGLTLGAAANANTSKTNEATHRYQVDRMTPLGVTLDWEYFPMTSSIVKGMPYATMRYDEWKMVYKDGNIILPTVASAIPIGKDPVVDNNNRTQLVCSTHGARPAVVEHEVKLYFYESDFTWLVFFSEPVAVQCIVEESGGIKLQVVDSQRDSSHGSHPLFIRTAVYRLCTSGRNPVYCHQQMLHPTATFIGQGRYGELLRNHSHLYPGPNTKFDYAVDNDNSIVMLKFDWDVQDMTNTSSSSNINKTAFDLISFALPHHLDIMDNTNQAGDVLYCAQSLTGPACLMEGSTWTLVDTIPDISFLAPRPPAPWSFVDLSNSLRNDISFQLPDFFQRGAGDTYFSGKMLAKLGRILLVAEELQEICRGSLEDTSDEPFFHDYAEACQAVSLPSAQQMKDAINSLKSSVEVWINGTAETPFVYDSSWGGVVSCGCFFDGGQCTNRFPDCPAFTDPGLDFGNAFYNDHHFHYGYHIYGAAVAAHFDPNWGRRHFEHVLLLVRDIANPTEKDEFFPIWRNKDWYQGHSWASGIAQNYRNGKNQESSSESIAAYEAIALFGKAMVSAFEEIQSGDDLRVAEEIRNIGQLLTASELRSAKRYYHIRKDEVVKIYPSIYEPHVIGIMWQSMAQFQTWFGAKPYLAIGIQLLPLTPISENRDDFDWAAQMYNTFALSCDSDHSCAESGWSILQLAILATVGHQHLASEGVQALPAEVFEGPGADGHSLTNSLWYIATRPLVDRPLPLNATATNGKMENATEGNILTDCYQPETCTEFVLDTIADLYSCRQRIQYIMRQFSKSQKDACYQVAAEEYPDECGACNPIANQTKNQNITSKCPPCTEEECRSELNRCPLYKRTYVCTSGDSRGGCSQFPWELDQGDHCDACCELTSCPEAPRVKPFVADESSCPPCPRNICRSRLNLCPSEGSAPYLCIEGMSTGGCSPTPWSSITGQCDECCKVVPGCEK